MIVPDSVVQLTPTEWGWDKGWIQGVEPLPFQAGCCCARWCWQHLDCKLICLTRVRAICFLTCSQLTICSFCRLLVLECCILVLLLAQLCLMCLILLDQLVSYHLSLLLIHAFLLVCCLKERYLSLLQEGLVYAVEFSHRSGRDLVNMAKKRTNVIPIIEDARHPARYRMLVGMVDVIFSDVAQPDQVYLSYHLYLMFLSMLVTDLWIT